jgi:hypothetical protein
VGVAETAGGVVSSTVTTTEPSAGGSGESVSVTVSVTVVSPTGKCAVGVGLVGSSKTMPGAVQSRVKPGPRVEPVPSSVTRASPFAHSTTTGSPGSAVGTAMDGVARIETEPRTKPMIDRGFDNEELSILLIFLIS